jgi:hypothetical protein
MEVFVEVIFIITMFAVHVLLLCWQFHNKNMLNATCVTSMYAYVIFILHFAFLVKHGDRRTSA